MRSKLHLSIAAALLAGSAGILTGYAQADGYPDKGRAIDRLEMSSDYSDLLAGRQRAVSIMRARAQGFVPSPQLHDYVKGVLMRELSNVKLPPTFQPDVRVLAAPEFAALCTPDGTIIVTIGLLEQLENEDELAFVQGHEVSHALYRHHDSDWFTRSQYYAVVSGAAVDDVSQQYSSVIGGGNAANIGRGFDAAQHLYKLSSNVLAPQMTRGQEDAADALGFDLMVKAGYNPEAALGLMDVLAEQEAEAAQASAQAKASDAASENAQPSQSSSGGGMFSGLGGLNVGGLNVGSLGLGGGSSGAGGGWADLGLSLFDKAVDSMSDEATSHHPAKQREELLSAYAYREYRTLTPGSPTPLPWGNDSKSPLKPALTTLLSHYSAAEDAAGYVADAGFSSEAKAQNAVQRSTSTPTTDHAYTEFVAAEFYEHRQPQLSEAALLKAANGPEPSWEVYARLTDIYIARSDYAHASSLMASAAQRLDNSPVLLPKRILILHALGDEQGTQKLLPECKAYDIRELYTECEKAAGKN